MAFTLDNIRELNLGYLTGIDLLAFIPQELLISKMNVDESLFPIWAKSAYAEISALLKSSIDVDAEFQKVGDERNAYVVKLTTLSFLQNITSTAPALSDNMANLLGWFVKECDFIRKSARSMTPTQVAKVDNYNNAGVVNQEFGTIGG